MMYNWQQPDWPCFSYNLQGVEETLFAFAGQMGHVAGMLETVPENIQVEARIDMMVIEAIKTSEIEDEFLSRADVVSSIRNNLSVNQTHEPVRDKRAQGAGELIVNVRKTYAEPLTEEKLFAWHNMLFRENRRINAGAWRTGEAPMQVVSGALGKETIHFEAPPSSHVPEEMSRFIQWFNDMAPGG